MMFERQNQRMRRLRLRRPRIQRPAVNRIIPNMLTVAALCSGMTAIRFALAGDWRNSALGVVVAAVLDGLAGASRGCSTRPRSSAPSSIRWRTSSASASRRRC